MSLSDTCRLRGVLQLYKTNLKNVYNLDKSIDIIKKSYTKLL